MLTRPPPLQLLLDNTRTGLRPVQQPQQPPTPVVEPGFFAQIGAFATQVYQANWRNFVIAIAAVNAFRFIISAVHTSYYTSLILLTQDTSFSGRSSTTPTLTIHVDNVSKLAQISVALGALYLATAIIQIFGAISAVMQRPTLIRVYVHLAFLAALLITTAGFISGVEYFLLAEDIIGECVALAISGSWISKSIFRGKLRHGQVPSTQVAQQQCRTAWSHGSISQVLGVVLFSVLPAVIFFLLAYTYYRQTTDPTHSACLNSKNGEAAYVRMEAYPNPSPIYNGSGNGDREAPAPRAQPLRARTPRVQPNRAAALLQLSPAMRTAADSPYGVSPGPPSYAPPRANVYGQVWFGAERR
ncbi:hypothetical protein DXG01_015388 [Tephrocybe rancida]|nr:hypothetical protein DXG01_015388 [Tephrocybe rancida]